METEKNNRITRLFLEDRVVYPLTGLQTHEGFTPWGPSGGSFGCSKDVDIDGSTIRLAVNYYNRGYGYKQRPGIEDADAGKFFCHYQAQLVPSDEGITQRTRENALNLFRSALSKDFVILEEKTE